MPWTTRQGASLLHAHKLSKGLLALQPEVPLPALHLVAVEQIPDNKRSTALDVNAFEDTRITAQEPAGESTRCIAL